MFWLTRPPFVRWAAGALLVVAAIIADVRSGGTELRPFAAADLAAGSEAQSASIEWRKVPAGLLLSPVLDGMTIQRKVLRGEPLTPSALTDRAGPPPGWWSIELRIPEAAEAGSRARIVVADPPLASEAYIVSISPGGAFDDSATGLVAVPSENVDAIARAAALGSVVVLVAP